jgi:hypothetical protein
MVAALVARVGRTAYDAMMLGCGFTLLAINSVWIKIVAEPFKAGRIIRELCLEVFQSERLHGRFAIAHMEYLL